jgi:peptide/nickel transport system permease protein
MIQDNGLLNTNSRSKPSEAGIGRQAWRRYKKNKLAVVGLGFMVFLAIISLLSPLLAPHNPFNSIKNAAGGLDIMAKPGHEYFLGTDSLGRDVFARLMYAGRISLSVGIISVFISTSLGVFFGSIAGYFGKWADSIIMRVVDIIYCFPVMFLIITVSALLKPSLYNVMIIIGLVSWTSTARLVRGEILRVRELEYIQAAKALGVKDFTIIIQHVLPNIMAPIVVQATLMMADAILTEAALSFLGVGVQAPTPSWGNMLNEAMSIMVLRFKYWIWLYPGLAILLTVLSINFIGDGLRDAFDPKLKGRK